MVERALDFVKTFQGNKRTDGQADSRSVHFAGWKDKLTLTRTGLGNWARGWVDKKLPANVSQSALLGYLPLLAFLPRVFNAQRKYMYIASNKLASLEARLRQE